MQRSSAYCSMLEIFASIEVSRLTAVQKYTLEYGSQLKEWNYFRRKTQKVSGITSIGDRHQLKIGIDFNSTGIWLTFDLAPTHASEVNLDQWKKNLIKKLLADTCPFWDHWNPSFEFLVTFPLGFKARVGSALFTFLWRLMWCTFSKIHIWCYTAQPLGSQQCSLSLPHMHQQRWDLAQIRTGNHPERRQTRYHCASVSAWTKYFWG